MKLIAKKPCSFGGEKFFSGDAIPTAYVLDPKMQEKRGVLAIVPDNAGTPNPAGPESGNPLAGEPEKKTIDIIPLVIQVEEGNLPLEVTAAGLQDVVNVLTGKAADVEALIGEMNDSDALILLHMLDSRKTIKVAAEERAKALNVEEESEQ